MAGALLLCAVLALERVFWSRGVGSIRLKPFELSDEGRLRRSWSWDRLSREVLLAFAMTAGGGVEEEEGLHCGTRSRVKRGVQQCGCVVRRWKLEGGWSARC